MLALHVLKLTVVIYPLEAELSVQSHSSIQVGEALTTDLVSEKERVRKTKFGLSSTVPSLGKLRHLTHMYTAALVRSPGELRCQHPTLTSIILFYILFFNYFGGQSLCSSGWP